MPESGANVFAGTIRVIYEITCGICHEKWTMRNSTSVSPTVRWARKVSRQLGWAHRKRFGFVCPNCLAKMSGNSAAIHVTEREKSGDDAAV